MQTIDSATASTSSRETRALIGSDKVEGTSVRRPNGDKIGEIERVMIEKRSGRVAYALMSFGGFLGIGADYYPIPWEKLKYNVALDAYELDLDESRLSTAPRHPDEGYQWSRDDDARIFDHWGATPYWTL